MNEELQRVATALAQSTTTLVLSGAGVSSASGIPTFRGEEGLWRKYRVEDLATPKAFKSDPVLVWEWYQWRLQLVHDCAPNAAHEALSQMEERFESFWIVTQNVDGYHQQAGSQQVIELHGSIRRARCLACGKRMTTPVGEGIPYCDCGGILRPDVVWFGETLPMGELQRAVDIARNCDLFITAGTSGLVEPAASLLSVAAVAGALIVEINPVRTAASHRVDVILEGDAERVLPAIIARL
jgi:NAD-dependent deacetylase